MQYPIILIPGSLITVKEKRPSLPSKPQKPQKPITTLKGMKLWFIIGILVFLIVFMNSGDSEVMPIGIIGLVLVFVALFYSKKNRDNKRNKYKGELEIFPEKVMEYKKRVNELLSPNNLNQYRQDELIKLLRKARNVSNLNESVNQGKYEPIFIDFLDKYFSGKILTNVSLGYFERPYVPDFAFIDTASGLHIDIEIDEPYVLQTKEPIHFKGSDDNRNNFFLSNHWIVIRFAEEQIAKQPLSCCKTIASTINEIINDNSYLLNFSHVENIKLVKVWSYEDSLFLAKSDYRNKY